MKVGRYRGADNSEREYQILECGRQLKLYCRIPGGKWLHRDTKRIPDTITARAAIRVMRGFVLRTVSAEKYNTILPG